MVKLIDNTPQDLEDFPVDQTALKKDLDNNKLLTLLDSNKNIDINELLKTYGLQYIPDEPWIQINDDTTIRCQVGAHEILTSLFFHPGQYEGIQSLLIANYLVLTSSVAEGQGGGLVIIDIETQRRIFKTNEFTIDEIIWIPNHQVFLCAYDLSTYAWHNISLEIIKLSGEICSVCLYNHNHLTDLKSHSPEELAPLTKNSNEKTPLQEDQLIAYTPQDDLIHLNVSGHWTCSVQQLIDTGNFEKL